jgi:hypothetical protein
MDFHEDMLEARVGIELKNTTHPLNLQALTMAQMSKMTQIAVAMSVTKGVPSVSSNLGRREKLHFPLATSLSSSKTVRGICVECLNS